VVSSLAFSSPYFDVAITHKCLYVVGPSASSNQIAAGGVGSIPQLLPVPNNGDFHSAVDQLPPLVGGHVNDAAAMAAMRAAQGVVVKESELPKGLNA